MMYIKPIMKEIKMGICNLYFSLFYSACGRPSKYRERNEQVDDAYWLISLLQGVNLISIMFFLSAVFGHLVLPPWQIFILFSVPLIINYFFFLKKGRIQILKEVDILISENKLKPKSLVVKYFIITLIFQALSAVLYGLL